MGTGLQDIHFHDATIWRVVEDRNAETLSFEVDYPVDWQRNEFEPRTITFRDVSGYRVDETPLAGLPTILECSAKPAGNGLEVILETNAGRRIFLCSGAELRAAIAGQPGIAPDGRSPSAPARR